MQDTTFERLVTCFEKAFGNLNPSDIPAATRENMAAWDSIAHVMLLNLVREEFDIDIDFEEFDGATSFATVLDLIRTRTVNA
jgi:acyl carrier protein